MNDTNVFRGGSWIDDARVMHSAYRFIIVPYFCDVILGFRVIKQLTGRASVGSGGSWICLSPYRASYQPSFHHDDLGFRVIKQERKA